MMHGQLSMVFWHDDVVHCHHKFMVYNSLIILAYNVNPESLEMMCVPSAPEYA
jgi:hypothetical protein